MSAKSCALVRPGGALWPEVLQVPAALLCSIHRTVRRACAVLLPAVLGWVGRKTSFNASLKMLDRNFNKTGEVFTSLIWLFLAAGSQHLTFLTMDQCNTTEFSATNSHRTSNLFLCLLCHYSFSLNQWQTIPLPLIFAGTAHAATTNSNSQWPQWKQSWQTSLWWLLRNTGPTWQQKV